MRRADRLIAIIQELRGARVLRAEDIAARLEVSVRTIYRDLADLQAHRVPIEGERGVGYLLRDGFFLPPLALDRTELEALSWGVGYVEAHADRSPAAAAQSLGRKLAAAGRKPNRASLVVYSRPPFRAFRERIALLRTAITQCRVVQLLYKDGDGATTERHVWPLELEHWGGATWTLTAWCALRDDYRVFRLDRIVEAGLREERFRPAPGRSIDDFRARMRAGHAA